MRVRSCRVAVDELDVEEVSFSPPEQTFLTRGKLYTVYTVSVYDGITCLQVVDDLSTPVFIPRSRFEIVDASIPEDWICTTLSTGKVQLILGPPHVAKDIDAYNRMIDQEIAQVETFWRRIDDGIVPPP
ncbi:hypothetical protein [Chondromyces crocatus]|uniref:Uncharacterized protein n=1 Tax=Chondromyces crocatus TaxID=52 RepID=A0A0K1ECV9_CHOCO|nr:hypothetical protein [Chondromyces crocatus]AKT38705.1 uncharacterized protein CMC5_028530 [Chondromyces crocatus]